MIGDYDDDFYRKRNRFLEDVCACVEDDKHFLLECPVYSNEVQKCV